MIVHSFSPENKWFDAYADFLGLFGLAANPGKLVSKQLPIGRTLHFGWTKGNPRFLSAWCGSADVRYAAHYGLNSDIAPCLKSAKERHAS
jgi:hypothetical protein